MKFVANDHDLNLLFEIWVEVSSNFLWLVFLGEKAFLFSFIYFFVYLFIAEISESTVKDQKNIDKLHKTPFP